MNLTFDFRNTNCKGKGVILVAKFQRKLYLSDRIRSSKERQARVLVTLILRTIKSTELGDVACSGIYFLATKVPISMEYIAYFIELDYKLMTHMSSLKTKIIH